MKTILSFIALCLLSAHAGAQSCECSEQFDWLQKKLALNYSGYRDKVTPENKAVFEQHTAGLQPEIASAGSDTACLRLLRKWARWFRDGHVQLSYRSGPATIDPVEIRQNFQNWEKIVLTETEVRTRFNRPDLDPIEGIYQNAEGSYRIALIRDSTSERDFAAVIIRADSVWWTPGQVKFDLKQQEFPGLYTARYYMRDHSLQNPTVKFADGKLNFIDFGTWYKQYPGSPNIPPKPQIFTLESLDANTLLLTVPTMSETVRLELDSLVHANAALLERTPNLVIDCRNNGGGSDVTFYPLLPYIYSGKVKSYKAQIYSTEDNIQKYDRLRHNKDYPKLYRLYYGYMARRMKRNKGKFVGKCGEETQNLKKLKSNPKRVAILINGRCGSSCEQFIYYAEQSTRVTLIGQPTAGIMDYGNLHTLDFPCDKFKLAYPTSRSCAVDAGKAIDGIGIPPDLRIDADVKDWVEYARVYLRGGK